MPPRISDVDLRNLPTGRVDLTQIIRNAAPTLQTVTVPFRQGFFVAEPEANAFVRVNSRMRLMVGVGYRLMVPT